VSSAASLQSPTPGLRLLWALSLLLLLGLIALHLWISRLPVPDPAQLPGRSPRHDLRQEPPPR
jgi:hypothetical protein